jgi:hypothetical protein
MVEETGRTKTPANVRKLIIRSRPSTGGRGGQQKEHRDAVGPSDARIRWRAVAAGAGACKAVANDRVMREPGPNAPRRLHLGSCAMRPERAAETAAPRSGSRRRLALTESRQAIHPKRECRRGRAPWRSGTDSSTWDANELAPALPRERYSGLTADGGVLGPNLETRGQGKLAETPPAGARSPLWCRTLWLLPFASLSAVVL